jgi:ubiquinone/menaquinone biosynthesis C-methylase UbiE
MLETLSIWRDQILQHATITQGETILDVGCGDGLIAFGALDRVGEEGLVIFSDISQDLLEHCHSLAQRLQVLDRCRFVRASADDLAAIAPGSVDVVTTRSVLIYVQAKQQALHEFYRVLKPGGRLSIFEPINRFCYPEPPQMFLGYDVTPIEEIACKVRAVSEGIHPPERSPLLNFDEKMQGYERQAVAYLWAAKR